MNHEDKNRATIPIADMESNSSDEPVGKEKTSGLNTRFNIKVTSYRKRKHDPDGISIKAVLDGLIRAGILQDDSTDEINEITFKSILSKEEKTIIELDKVAI